MNEDIEKTNEKQEKKGNPAWYPGMPSPNPNGRPKGRKNFDTIFEEAIRKIVEEKKINIDDPEREMVIKAVIEALKGSYPHFRDLMDRRYGKAPQPVELGGRDDLPVILKIVKDDGTNN